MISNDIQELLKNITKSLIKIETKELDALISRQLTHIDNIDFHRYEISHRKIESLKFSFCSFRGAFISYSSFKNGKKKTEMAGRRLLWHSHRR